MTSLWSPKIDRAWVASVRAATWNTVEVSSPAILNMFGIISSKTCDAVNVVAADPACNAPWMASAADAPALALPFRPPRVWCPRGWFSTRRTTDPPIPPCWKMACDGIDGDDFVGLMGNVCGCFVAVDEDFGMSAVDELVNSSPPFIVLGFACLNLIIRPICRENPRGAPVAPARQGGTGGFRLSTRAKLGAGSDGP